MKGETMQLISQTDFENLRVSGADNFVLAYDEETMTTYFILVDTKEKDYCWKDFAKFLYSEYVVNTDKLTFRRYWLNEDENK